MKPDHGDAHIVSCAVCWQGRKTIAYPWAGEALEATEELLVSPRVKKIGANIKFEQRWTYKAFGHGVRGWLYDGMVGAHVLDNRQGITSVKFQAFVRLGLSPYDESVRPYLEAKDSNSPNRIHEVPLEDLLLYNGIDAIAEWHVAQDQMKEMGYECP